jgi:translation initiation factor 5B
MPPKKKGNKRQEEDWEAELGETVPGVDDQPVESKTEANNEEDDETSGGLLAAVRKNRNKKAKKGKPLNNDFVDGEDPEQDIDGSASLVNKQPEEATFDDDDIFGPPKRGKVAPKPANAQPDEELEEPEDDFGKVKSKKEKEKEKKEREKQRKKEQVRIISLINWISSCFCNVR